MNSCIFFFVIYFIPDPRLILSLPLKDNCSPTLTSTSNFFAPLEQGQQVHQGQRALIGQQVMPHSLKHNQVTESISALLWVTYNNGHNDKHLYKINNNHNFQS